MYSGLGYQKITTSEQHLQINVLLSLKTPFHDVIYSHTPQLTQIHCHTKDEPKCSQIYHIYSIQTIKHHTTPNKPISHSIEGVCHTYVKHYLHQYPEQQLFAFFSFFSLSNIKILPFYYIFGFLRKRRFYALKNAVRGMELPFFTILPFFHPLAQPDTTSTVRSFFTQNVLSYPLIELVFTSFHFRIHIHIIHC